MHALWSHKHALKGINKRRKHPVYEHPFPILSYPLESLPSSPYAPRSPSDPLPAHPFSALTSMEVILLILQRRNAQFMHSLTRTQLVGPRHKRKGPSSSEFEIPGKRINGREISLQRDREKRSLGRGIINIGHKNTITPPEISWPFSVFAPTSSFLHV